MSDLSTPDLLAVILRLVERRRLAHLMGVSESAIRKWSNDLATPRPKHRIRLERLAREVVRFERIARGEPLPEELVV